MAILTLNGLIVIYKWWFLHSILSGSNHIEVASLTQQKTFDFSKDNF